MQILKQIRLIESIQYSLLCGKSVKQSIEEFIERNPDPDYLQLRNLDASSKLPLFHLLRAGIDGQSVGENLANLKEDLVEKFKIDMEVHLKWLPVVSMAPVLIFMFPAFLLLLIGPVVAQFLNVLG